MHTNIQTTSTSFSHLLRSLWIWMSPAITSISLTYAERGKLLHKVQRKCWKFWEMVKNQPWLEAADNERPECCCLSRNVWNETKPTEGSQIMRVHGREDFYCAWITDLITLPRMERRRPRYTRIFHNILNHILSRSASLKHISTSCRWLRTSAWHLLNLLCDPSLSGR